jgi:hypothetical protein
MKLLTAVQRMLRIAAGAVELRDVVFLGGVVMVWIGGSRISGPWTLVCMGGALALISIPWRK